MRIFLTLHPSSNLSVPGSMTWYRNLYEPLIDIGCEVHLLRMDEIAQKHQAKFRSLKFREVFSQELPDAFTKAHEIKSFDLILCYLTDLDIEPGSLHIIKKNGVPIANFSCNNTHQFHLVEKLSPLFDFNLHSEKDADQMFRKIGANPVWFPMAANPKFYFPRNIGYKFDISFIGSAYARRAFYINHLITNSLDVNCFGPNWLINRPYENLKKIKKESERLYWNIVSILSFSPEKRYLTSSKINYYDLLSRLRSLNAGKLHYPPDDNEIMDIIGMTKINLGFLEVFLGDPGTEVKSHLHLREFEVPMCGGFYLTNFSEELCEFFEPDKEVAMFFNEYDLLDKVRFFIAHETERVRIKMAGHRRAMNCHTYQKRFKDLFAKIMER